MRLISEVQLCIHYPKMHYGVIAGCGGCNWTPNRGEIADFSEFVAHLPAASGSDAEWNGTDLEEWRKIQAAFCGPVKKFKE